MDLLVTIWLFPDWRLHNRNTSFALKRWTPLHLVLNRSVQAYQKGWPIFSVGIIRRVVVWLVIVRVLSNVSFASFFE